MSRLIPLFFLVTGLALADQMETVVVQDVQEKVQRTGTVKDSIIKTEVITAKSIEKKGAKTISEAIENEPGIDTQNGCSVCGIKRVQINGLKGEYTTVLMDDIPLHSTVSSYYGFDAMVTAGVARIEVARGAGAALLAPEAIGGVINIISKKATENSLLVDIAGGNTNYRVLSVVGTAVSQDGSKRATVAAQHNLQDQWDGDGNGVNESPKRSNHSILARVSSDLGVNTNIDVRVSALRSETFGGPMGGAIFGTAVQNAPLSFQDGDVRKKYTGSPQMVNETVEVDRTEIAAKVTQLISNDTNMTATVSVAEQKQDSIYEGNDYANVDYTYFADVRLNHQLFERHLITTGVDTKVERLRSRSYKYFTLLGVARDDFDHFTPGIYLQDTWTPWDSLEISGAVRFNVVQVDWTAQTAKKNEIDRSLLVPRIHVKWTHFPELVSRLSFGQGYRAPLSFFESEHGILNDGFDVSISEVERSNSAVYSLSYDDKKAAATVSGAWTGVNNLAYIDKVGRPTLRNDSGFVSVGALDALASYQLMPAFQLGAGYEHFFYSERYKSLLPMAAIEDRIRFLADWATSGWEANCTVNVIGGRDLAPYNYGGHYNVFSAGVASSEKGTKAPLYATVDARVARKIGKEISLYFGVKNLFDYTQTKTESPLFFDVKGKLEVTHIWGPVRGRQVYAGLQAKF